MRRIQVHERLRKVLDRDYAKSSDRATNLRREAHGITGAAIGPSLRALARSDTRRLMYGLIEYGEFKECVLHLAPEERGGAAVVFCSRMNLFAN
jgi:hypothetical protein